MQVKVVEPVMPAKKFGPAAKEQRRKEKEEKERQRAVQVAHEEEKKKQATKQAAYDPHSVLHAAPSLHIADRVPLNQRSKGPVGAMCGPGIGPAHADLSGLIC